MALPARQLDLSAMNFIAISHPLMEAEEQAAVAEVLASGQLAQGPRVREFEQRFAAWCGAKHAIATSSGTTALFLALLAHGVGPGDEVVTASFSFIASANCALYAGARPIFADIELDTFTLDPADVERRLTPRTRAILPVHLFGQAANLDALASLSQQRGLVLIQDACQAHGARFGGRPLAAFGTACYSFYATKNMTTGEGGMVTTDDDAVAARARQLREHGSTQRYRHDILGYNARMTDIQAAIGVAQLPKVDEWNRRRQANAAGLTARLGGCPHVSPPVTRPGATHVFHQYTVRLKGCDRDAAVGALHEAGIGAGVYYPVPIHQQPLYQDLGYHDRLPVTEAACAEVLSLPVHPSLCPADLDRIAAAVSAL
jgi:perosamine synthetase